MFLFSYIFPVYVCFNMFQSTVIYSVNSDKELNATICGRLRQPEVSEIIHSFIIFFNNKLASATNYRYCDWHVALSQHLLSFYVHLLTVCVLLLRHYG